MKDARQFATVEEYISLFPPATKTMLKAMRKTIRDAAPSAEEVIAYNMPAYKLNGPLVYFAAYEKHIGFYPTASGIAAFAKELSGWKSAKGSVQFPLDEPLPLRLIGKIVKFRVGENEKKAAPSKRKKA